MVLHEDQIEGFRRDGYLIVEDALTDSDLAPVIEELERIIDQRAADYLAHGRISDLYRELPFERRFGAIYREHGEIGKGLDLMQYQGEAIFAFLRNANLMALLGSLLGPEITCNPIQHVRAKVPATMFERELNFINQGDVEWHQDAGVVWEEADASNIITVWIPLVDATVELGCMQVIPGAHRSGYLAHQRQGALTILPGLLPETEPVAAPCPKGGVVLLDQFMPHAGLPNRSDLVRWSVDLRYQQTGVPSGRPFYPDFPVHSERAPDSVLTDHAEWCRRWDAALRAGAGIPAHREKALVAGYRSAADLAR